MSTTGYIKQLVKRSPVSAHLLGVYRYFVSIYRHHKTDYYVISYPKCGRTWIRVMLAKSLALYFGDPRDIVYEPSDVINNVRANGPVVRFTHDGSGDPPDPKIDNRRYYRYANKRVIFLVRDPRDVMVSYYFQRTRRQNESYSLSDFIRHPWWGIDRLIDFMRGWYEHRHVPLDFLLVRYEDLHRDPKIELRRILQFLGIIDISDDIIRNAVSYASFDNMRKMSLSELKHWSVLAPTNPNDPESFKVRRGEVGGYKKYLTREDIEYIEEKMRRGLPSFFGYNPSC